MKSNVLHYSVALLGIIGAAVLIFILVGIYDRNDGVGDDVLFRIQNGESFSSVRNRLSEEKLIDHPRAVALYALLKRYDRHVKAGTYRLRHGETARDIVGVLVRGDVYKVAVTIPEGFMAHEIVAVMAAEAFVDSTGLAGALKSKSLLGRLGIGADSLEGYLFPDTYWIAWEASPLKVAETMVRRFEQVFDDDAQRRAEEINMTRHEIVTLASIIQAETRLDEELALVSAVYHNRMRIGMRLEADPTVAYAMGGYRGRLFYRDLEIDSPYNTYKHAGLPPGPICSPGSGALTAALYPDTTCDAIYFVAQGNGGHVFSRTLSDHIDAVNNVRRDRRQKGKGTKTP